MSITAKELAKELNLSAAAVSMALNNRPGVSQATREKVIRAAEKRGYDFSRLTGHKPRGGEIWCVVYRDINVLLNQRLFVEIFDGIERECRAREYRYRLRQGHAEEEELNRFLDELRVESCAGMILMGTEMDDATVMRFLELKIPIVLLDLYSDTLPCSSVIINNLQGAYAATAYLMRHKKGTPGYLKSSVPNANFFERGTGFDRALRAFGVPLGSALRYTLTPTVDGACTDMLELIDAGEPMADAYFADNDVIAIGAMMALQQRGYKIPEDVAIMGFDDVDLSVVTNPPLSTVAVPRTFMGRTAMRQLAEEIENPIPHSLRIEVSTTLKKRSSVVKKKGESHAKK